MGGKKSGFLTRALFLFLLFLYIYIGKALEGVSSVLTGKLLFGFLMVFALGSVFFFLGSAAILSRFLGGEFTG